MGSLSELEISMLETASAFDYRKYASPPMLPGQDLQPPQNSLLDLAEQYATFQKPWHLNSQIVSHMRSELDKLKEELKYFNIYEEKLKDLDKTAEIGIGAGIEKSPILPERILQNDHLSSGQGLPEDDSYTKLVVNGVWARLNAATNSFRGLMNHEEVYRWYIGAAIDRIIEEKAMYAELRPMLFDREVTVAINPRYDPSRTLSNYTKSNSSEVIAEIDRILEERSVYAELRPMLLDRSITVAIHSSPGQSAQYIASRGLSDYLSNHTLEQGQGGWHTNRLGQGLGHLGGIHLSRTRLPRRKASLLRTLSIVSCASILVAGAHLPRGIRALAGVLSLSADVANIPMHMRTDYTALRWSLFAFCLVAYAAFVGSLWYTLRGTEQRHQAYLFYAIFTGVGAIGTTLVADKVGDTVNSVLAFGPLALTLIAGLFYMPFRYRFSVGAHQVVDVEMQAQPGH